MRWTLLGLVVVPSTVWGQPDPAPTLTPAPPPSPSIAPAATPSTARLWLGPQLDLLPAGSLHIAASGTSASIDTATAIGLGGVLEYRVSPIVGVGLAPRFLFPVKAQNATDSGSQLDLRSRVTIGNHVAPRVHLHGIATVGYSRMMHVLAITDANGMVVSYATTSGLVFGLGAGVTYEISPRLLFAGELSYQLGYQGTTVMGTQVSAGDNYLTLGFGVLAALDRRR